MAMDEWAIVRLHQKAGEAAARGNLQKAIDLCTSACEESLRAWQESGKQDDDAEMSYMLGLRELAMLHYRANKVAIADRLMTEYEAFHRRMMDIDDSQGRSQ